MDNINMRLPPNLASASYGARILDCSSEMEGCEADNVLTDKLNRLWLTESTGLPQFCSVSLTSLRKDTCIRTLGWQCWHAYTTNPHIVTVHVSADGFAFKVWDSFTAKQRAGPQLFCCAPISLSIYPFIAFEIVKTFGGLQTYMNRIFLYSDEVPSGSPQSRGSNSSAGSASGTLVNVDVILDSQDDSRGRPSHLESDNSRPSGQNDPQEGSLSFAPLFNKINSFSVYESLDSALGFALDEGDDDSKDVQVPQASISSFPHDKNGPNATLEGDENVSVSCDSIDGSNNGNVEAIAKPSASLDNLALRDAQPITSLHSKANNLLSLSPLPVPQAVSNIPLLAPLVYAEFKADAQSVSGRKGDAVSDQGRGLDSQTHGQICDIEQAGRGRRKLSSSRRLRVNRHRRGIPRQLKTARERGHGINISSDSDCIDANDDIGVQKPHARSSRDTDEAAESALTHMRLVVRQMLEVVEDMRLFPSRGDDLRRQIRSQGGDNKEGKATTAVFLDRRPPQPLSSVGESFRESGVDTGADAVIDRNDYLASGVASVDRLSAGYVNPFAGVAGNVRGGAEYSSGRDNDSYDNDNMDYTHDRKSNGTSGRQVNEVLSSSGSMRALCNFEDREHSGLRTENEAMPFRAETAAYSPSSNNSSSNLDQKGQACLDDIDLIARKLHEKVLLRTVREAQLLVIMNGLASRS